MAEGASPAEVRAAQEIVRETVGIARRLAEEQGLDTTFLLSIAAWQLQAFSLGAGLTGVEPEDFLEREAHIVRFAKTS